MWDEGEVWLFKDAVLILTETTLFVMSACGSDLVGVTCVSWESHFKYYKKLAERCKKAVHGAWGLLRVASEGAVEPAKIHLMVVTRVMGQGGCGCEGEVHGVWKVKMRKQKQVSRGKKMRWGRRGAARLGSNSRWECGAEGARAGDFDQIPVFALRRNAF